MGIPQVAIVGRPNVGKSSLFNWLAGRRLAIVDPTAGVTRDRVTQLIEIDDRSTGSKRLVELVDTGGMGIEDADKLTEHIEEQINVALDSAAVVLFVVDTRTGIATLDEEVDRRLRPVSVPVVCVANKTDTREMEPAAQEFHRLRPEVIAVSAVQDRGKDELLEAICARLPAAVEGDDAALPETVMKLAIVGRRNVGKSTFVNMLVQEERMIVSEVPGTTRDSVDVRFELDGKPFLAIDTPGFRRRQSMATNVDYYGSHRAERSIRRADVVLMFFDAAEPVSKVDKQLVDYIAEQHKPCIFVVNKWDLMVGQTTTGKWVEYLRDTFRTMTFVPVECITAQTGKNMKALLQAPWGCLRNRGRACPRDNSTGWCARRWSGIRPRSTEGDGRKSSTPRRWRWNRRPSCSSATIRRRCRNSTSAICWAFCATSFPSAKCRSSFTCARARQPTAPTRSTPS